MSTLNDKVRIIVGVIYAFFFIYLLFFASFRHDTLTDVNLIPFKSIIQSLEPFTKNPSAEYILYVLIGILGNFLLLLPIPILFKLDWSGGLKWISILLLPFIIELIQFLFAVGSADIDDLLLNSSGFALGFWLRKKRL